MAYLHCHNCDFSQDDFWDWSFSVKYGFFKFLPFVGWRYNPMSYFLSRVFSQSWYDLRNWRWMLIIPRRMDHDDWWAKECGWKRRDPFSWYLIWWEFKMMIRTLKKQKYTTYKAWKKAIERNNGHWPVCPICGKNELDID